MGYLNPLLELPAGRALLTLPDSDRLRIAAVMRDLREHANVEAETAWRRRKGPVAAYWRSVATYARHVGHACRRGAEGNLSGTVHVVKSDPLGFEDVRAGRKTCELRIDDRGYAPGDVLVQRETRFSSAEMAGGAPLEYTGRTVANVISHVLRGPTFGLVAGWAMLSLGATVSARRAQP